MELGIDEIKYMQNIDRSLEWIHGGKNANFFLHSEFPSYSWKSAPDKRRVKWMHFRWYGWTSQKNVVYLIDARAAGMSSHKHVFINDTA